MTPLQIVGTMDRMDRCDIYYGKLVSKRMSLVPEAYYWYKLSVNFLFSSSNLPQLAYAISTCVYTFFATIELPIKVLKVLSKFQWKRI